MSKAYTFEFRYKLFNQFVTIRIRSLFNPKKLSSVYVTRTGSEFKYMKHKIDVLDEATMTYSYTLIEGDLLMDKLEKVTYETKMEASEDGGTKGKNGSTYYTKPGVEIKEEEIKAGKEKAAGLLKAVEAYLLANPEIYAWIYEDEFSTN